MSKVTLTFDNGPEPSVTPQVLDCLACHHALATFFVLGEKATTQQGAGLVRRASAEGHRIGSHTWSHRILGTLDAADALSEFERGAEAVANLGIEERLFRPRGGGGRLGNHLLHAAVLPKLEAGRFTCVLWNLVTGDWHDPNGWQDRALDGIRAREWSLLVLHDLPGGAMDHLDALLTCLAEEGHSITQEYPPECLPIVDGRTVQSLAPYLAAG